MRAVVSKLFSAAFVFVPNPARPEPDSFPFRRKANPPPTRYYEKDQAPAKKPTAPKRPTGSPFVPHAVVDQYGFTAEDRAADPYPDGIETNALADLLCLSPRRIQQLTMQGVLVRREHGRYDFMASVNRYVGRLEERRLNPDE